MTGARLANIGAVPERRVEVAAAAQQLLQGRRSQPHALFYVRSVTRMKGNANEVTRINARTAYTHPGRRTSPFPARTRTRSA